MPHKGNGAMFIQYFIPRGFDARGHSEEPSFSQAFLERSQHENLKDLQVHLKVPSRRLLRP